MAEDHAQKFLQVMDTAISIPGVRISREQFLRQQFPTEKYGDKLDKIITDGPVMAGVSADEIKKLAIGCINFETTKVTALSAVAGIPGGLAMIGTIPADMAQFYGHVLRVMQKVMYLYGFNDLSTMDDEAKNILIIFLGVMSGVGGVETVAARICEGAAAAVAKKLASQPLTKGVIYPIVKKIAAYLGVKMTKDIFAKGVSKLLPVVGAVFSGTLTIATFKPMSHRLLRFFENQYDTIKDSDVIEAELNAVINDE